MISSHQLRQTAKPFGMTKLGEGFIEYKKLYPDNFQTMHFEGVRSRMTPVPKMICSIYSTWSPSLQLLHLTQHQWRRLCITLHWMQAKIGTTEQCVHMCVAPDHRATGDSVDRSRPSWRMWLKKQRPRHRIKHLWLWIFKHSTKRSSNKSKKRKRDTKRIIFIQKVSAATDRPQM